MSALLVSLRSRAWAVAFAVVALIVIDHAVAHAERGLTTEQSILSAGKSQGEPFGLLTVALPEGPLVAKWRDAERAIRGDINIIADCRADISNCISPAAIQFLKIANAASSRDGLARLGEINRAINLAVRPVSDRAQYGVDDHWTSPLATLAAGAGDCEDYAIAKLVALHEAGVSRDNVRLIIMRENATGEDHAVVAARVDGRWHILDNRFFVMVEDAEISKYTPVFAVDAEGIKRVQQPEIAVAMHGATGSEAKPANPDADVTISTIAPASAMTEADDSWYVHVM
ncbi:transglutaminase-like cysteine peptidase [Bradyrhizobium sp. SYSU BS000235]|uniref:transglutaminase-like cysteine peptidase n=1 Tax=Bradyrhizobium sp. SYSU BS000235 TaxID=3411332 RepID=UPI003C71FED0